MGRDRPEYAGARWFTSSYSSGSAQCVEVAFLPGHRLVRDSKLGAVSPELAVSPTEWSAFTAVLKGRSSPHGAA